MKQFMYMAAIAMGVSFVSCNETAGKPDQPANDTLALAARGKYLVTVIGCGDCHTPKIMTERGPVPDMEKFLSGYQAGTELGKFDTAMTKDGRWALLKGDLTAAVGPWGITYAANLTPDDSGLGGWTLENFSRAIKGGKYRGVENSRPLMPPMPVESLRNLTDEDVEAIYSYLKTIKPVKNLVPAAQLNPPPGAAPPSAASAVH
ncbi:c-type cytochrome [Paraflavitalea sp. CAU 1676]|uniref:c-type cytochrome n=1 Tax=Paraflavitalea sp. CAU 1676 TaxID=3032598 RepID=UPI0023DA30B5|nr:c-type cytochrome [Paraflavitalea sp. CAU 1676]MDF2191454.1 c-type cytochrome [Paraflavitalea sp. CAU 1676]